MPSGSKTDVESAARPYQGLISRLSNQVAIEATIGDGRGFELAAKAMDKIAEADTLDGIFEANSAASLPSMEDFLGQPFTIEELSFNQSADEYKRGGVGAYAYVKAMLDNAEFVEFTVGAPNVVSSLFRIQEIGLLSKTPKPRVVVKGKKTGNGTLYQLLKP